MNMHPVATVEFVDRETTDGGIATVRASKGSVALGLSLRANGDIEVFLDAKACHRLTEALLSALAIADDVAPPLSRG